MDLYEGDRIEVQRGDCPNWSHDSEWAPNGTRGTVSGTWLGHPGVEDGHHISVDFSDRHMFVASLSFREDELKLVRRGPRRRSLSAMGEEQLDRARLAAPQAEVTEGGEP